MLLVFLAGIAPKEYLHELFFHHHDTVEPILKKGEFVIHIKHTHCSFLSFQFGPFVASEEQVISFHEDANHADYLLPFYNCYYLNAFKVISLRGPPAC